MTPYRLERLANHDRNAFASGSDALDRYFTQQASQNVRRRIASCFVAVSREGAVAGYYTLAATALALTALPPARARKLPRYPIIPATLLGRLVVATPHQGRRLGAALVADALLRSTRSEIAAYALVVEAKDEAAARFYRHLEFEPLAGDSRRLIRIL